MLKETFGENVRYYRKKKKLTLESATELCDISSRYLERIERAGKREEGKPSMSIDIIEKISKNCKIFCKKTFFLVTRSFEIFKLPQKVIETKQKPQSPFNLIGFCWTATQI